MSDDIDWAHVASLPALTIDGSDLDRLELALGDPGLRLAPSADLAGELVLVDRQATPLALVSARDAADRPRLQALRPRAAGHTDDWDQRLRMPVAAVRARLAGSGCSRIVGVAFDRLPTVADAAFVRGQLDHGDTAVVMTALVGGDDDDTRRAGDPGRSALRVGATALARAVAALAASLHSESAVAVALPWSRRPATGALQLDIEAAGESAGGPTDDPIPRLLAACGATETPALPAPDDVERALDDAETHWHAEVERMLPAAIARELTRSAGGAASGHPATELSGAVVLFTGLSGSGKSTLAEATAAVLREHGDRVTVLDGDDVRRHLSSELGFDRESRSTNVRRIGWVGALVAEHGGIALAAPIAPFQADRAEVRRMAEAAGAFLLVYVSTPLEECARRDRKGLYARALAGELAEFTGVSSPYEAPQDADVVVDTSSEPIAESLERILAALEARRLGERSSRAG